MPKRIPINAVAEITKKFSLEQSILVAWDGERTHVVTHGNNAQNCAFAATGGNVVKKALGWPDNLCRAESAQVLKLKNRIAQLEAALRPLVSVATAYENHELDEARPGPFSDRPEDLSKVTVVASSGGRKLLGLDDAIRARFLLSTKG